MTSYEKNHLDFIIGSSDTMIKLFNEIRDLETPSSGDLDKLTELYASVTTAISEYYAYLEKTGIPYEESYLTHWLKKGDYDDYYDEIDCFLA
jgi:hypothetical protein